MELADILTTGPALEQICQELTFEELKELWRSQKWKSLPCKLPVEETDFILPEINAKTIAAYPYLQNHVRFEKDALLQSIRDKNRLATQGILDLNKWDLNERYQLTEEYRTLTPIQTAALVGDIPMIEHLVVLGAELLSEQFDSQPLLTAIVGGQVETVQFLLEKGANPNEIFDNYSYFDVAVGLEVVEDFEKLSPEASFQIVQLLVKYGGNPNYTINDGEEIFRGYPLITAIEDPNNMYKQSFRYLLEHGADPNLKDNRYNNESEFYAINYAVNTGKPDLVRLLLEHGADPNLPELVTPLADAARYGRVEMVDALLEYRANPNMVSGDGRVQYSPLYIVMGWLNNPTYSSKESIQLLLEAGADPNWISSDGFSVFEKALKSAPDSIIRVMLKHGANPNVFLREIGYPLAGARHNPDLTLDLLKAGANPNVKDSLGTPVLHLWIGHYRVMKSLLKHGADPNILNYEIPMLVKVIQQDEFESFKLLLQYGANIDQQFLNGTRVWTIREYLQSLPRPLMKRYLENL